MKHCEIISTFKVFSNCLYLQNPSDRKMMSCKKPISLDDFVDKFEVSIISCKILPSDSPHIVREVSYRLRLKYKPTNRFIYTSFENYLYPYHIPFVRNDEVIQCLNNDASWWMDGGWNWVNGGIERSYASYRNFYMDHNGTNYEVKDYIQLKNLVTVLRKVMGDDFDMFYRVA